MKLQNKNILIYFQDEGSSNYLFDVIEEFKFNNHNLFFLINNNVKSFAIKIRKKILGKKNLEIIKNKKKIFFDKYIKKYKINICITTCAQIKIDKSNHYLIKSALEKKIIVLTFLDQWKGYERFKIYIKNKNLIHIGVIDKIQKEYLIENFNLVNISVVGHPSLEKLKKIKRNQNDSILIVSEPSIKNKFKSIYLKNDLYINKLIYFIDKYNLSGPNNKVFFRKHPKESSNKDLLSLRNKIKIDNLSEINSLKKFNNFIGFETIFLKKALLTGANVLNIKNINELSLANFNSSKKKLNNVNFNKLKKKIISSKLRCHELLNTVLNLK